MSCAPFRASVVCVVSALTLLLGGCQGGLPTITKATVADHVVSEDKSYQSADRQAMLVHFADVRRQIHRLDLKISGLQKDVVQLKAQQADMAEAIAVAPPPQPVAAPVPVSREIPKAKPSQQMAKPAHKPSVPVAAVSTPPVTGGPLRVLGVRLGDATDHTRLVFDASGATKVTVELDNQERLLVLTLPKTAWDAARSKTFGTDKRLEGYQVMSGTGPNTQIVFTLRRPVTVGAAVALPPSGSRGHRVYIDLK